MVTITLTLTCLTLLGFSIFLFLRIRRFLRKRNITLTTIVSKFTSKEVRQCRITDRFSSTSGLFSRNLTNKLQQLPSRTLLENQISIQTCLQFKIISITPRQQSTLHHQQHQQTSAEDLLKIVLQITPMIIQQWQRRLVLTTRLLNRTKVPFKIVL